jgi:hypothetical protein
MQNKVTPLKTARKLDEAGTLLVNIVDACDWLACCEVPTNEYAVGVRGLFEVFGYAALAAYESLDEYTREFVEKHGFSYPLNGEENRARDKALSSAT